MLILSYTTNQLFKLTRPIVCKMNAGCESSALRLVDQIIHLLFQNGKNMTSMFNNYGIFNAVDVVSITQQ